MLTALVVPECDYIPSESSRDRILESRDEYPSHNVFWVPDQARWEQLGAALLQQAIMRANLLSDSPTAQSTNEYRFVRRRADPTWREGWVAEGLEPISHVEFFLVSIPREEVMNYSIPEYSDRRRLGDDLTMRQADDDDLAVINKVIAAANALSAVSEYLADEFPEQEMQPVTVALQTLGLAMSSALASVDTKCTIGGAKPANVSIRPRGRGGAMIMKCSHGKPHCWDLAGNRLFPCP